MQTGSGKSLESSRCQFSLREQNTTIKSAVEKRIRENRGQRAEQSSVSNEVERANVKLRHFVAR
jgi:hypothetical protein